jgi:hypothetical protein
MTYGRVYRRAFAAGTRGLEAWVQRGVSKRRPFHLQVAWTRHVHTLVCTQFLAANLSSETKRSVAHAARLAHIGAVLRLRVLQRRILDYLWRPGGPMCRRHAKEALACLAG